MNGPKFSVIMPSYLGRYDGAAKDRDTKIIRAIESVVQQTFTDWELIIISDGCDRTVSIVLEHVKTYTEPLDIILIKVPKQPRWGGIRNFGIEKAKGEYVIYLDIDDMYAPGYLEAIAVETTDGQDWYYTDDLQIYGTGFQRIQSNVHKIGKCGTANIIHKRSMKARWLRTDYGEDWQFIKQLRAESQRSRRIKACGYYVCHVPRRYDL